MFKISTTIDSAQKALEQQNDPYFWQASTPILVIVIAVAVLFFITLLSILASSDEGDRLRSFGVAVGSIATVGLAATALFIGVGKYEHGQSKAYYERVVEQAYHNAVLNGFDVDEKDVKNAKVDYSDAKTGPKLKVEHIDLEENAHYNLVFLFDLKADEAILLESENVTEEVIEKLTRDSSRVDAASFD